MKNARWAFDARSGMDSRRTFSRLWKNYCGTVEIPWFARLDNMRTMRRMLKKAVSKAAASEEARRTLRYVELLSDARTPPGDRRV